MNCEEKDKQDTSIVSNLYAELAGAIAMKFKTFIFYFKKLCMCISSLSYTGMFSIFR
ncbi:hypothetical protein Chro_5656 (plasmid) [Chroococcidiopsis thermalis PCC 7203]|uniref:Uncharacterized protein n=1 Tax=Chroococcidiopsis thermalis (strain PCC 7203) TaxID=251229 RepID=K9U8Q5_CHRTP|nr:hypothetical protein Chro_5656 [Chroococcidiopsis thermalis PCC 7203]